MHGLFQPGSRKALLQYDVDSDQWTELPLPPSAAADFCCDIVAAGDAMVAYPSSDEYGESADYLFDTATGEWTELPADPLSPTFGRVMVWSGTELVLFANDLVPQPGSDGPSLGKVAAFDQSTAEWRSMPDTGSIGVGGAMIDGRIVNPALGWADGGETNNWGQEYPYGGILDPERGEWSELPNAPGGQNDFAAGVYGGGQGYYVGESGYVLDVEAETWGWIEPRPGTDRGHGGPYISGVSLTAVGESMFVYGGGRWEAFDDPEPEWLDEAWMWRP